MGRRLKSRVPCHPDELKPRTSDADLVRKKEKEYRKQMQVNYDCHHKATKEADELSPGLQVSPPLKASCRMSTVSRVSSYMYVLLDFINPSYHMQRFFVSRKPIAISTRINIHTIMVEVPLLCKSGHFFSISHLFIMTVYPNL